MGRPERYIANLEEGGFDKIEQLQALNPGSLKAKRLLLMKLPEEYRLQVVFSALRLKMTENA